MLEESHEPYTPHVLIIGDHLDISGTLRRQLQAQQLDVLIVLDGLTALSMISKHEPVLILLDANLPAFNGFYLCRLIRKALEVKQVPIIILSERESFLVALRAWLARATMCHTMPYSIEEWHELVRKYVTPP